jgi:hypothetical protein
MFVVLKQHIAADPNLATSVCGSLPYGLHDDEWRGAL